MYDTKRDTIDAMSGMPDVLRHLALEPAPAQSRTPPAPPGEWGLIEIVCHLRDAEERAIERTRLMRDHDNPVAPYDPAKWAVERDYALADLAAVLTSFQFFRDMHVSELEAIPWTDWHRGGRHAEYGPIDILGHALHVASHDAIHLRQIAHLGTQW